VTSYAHIRETELRNALPVGAKLAHDEFTIIELGRFLPGNVGLYPAIQAILARDPHEVALPERPYSVHMIVSVCTPGGISAPCIDRFEISGGTYDLDLDSAKNLLDQR
jgi:hypothetical protein